MEVQRKIIVFDAQKLISVAWYKIIDDDGDTVYARQKVLTESQWEKYIKREDITTMSDIEASGEPPLIGS